MWSGALFFVLVGSLNTVAQDNEQVLRLQKMNNKKRAAIAAPLRGNKLRFESPQNTVWRPLRKSPCSVFCQAPFGVMT